MTGALKAGFSVHENDISTLRQRPWKNMSVDTVRLDT
jgi:hypothetical protein